MDQKLRDLRTLKQHYYPEVNIVLWSDIQAMALTLAILVKTSLSCSHHCQQVSALPQGGWGWLVITVAILVNIIAVGTQVKKQFVEELLKGQKYSLPIP